jgi:hypothetical protein
MVPASAKVKSVPLRETLPKILSSEERQRAQMEICIQNLEIWNNLRSPDELSRIYDRDMQGMYPLIGVRDS